MYGSGQTVYDVDTGELLLFVGDFFDYEEFKEYCGMVFRNSDGILVFDGKSDINTEHLKDGGQAFCGKTRSLDDQDRFDMRRPVAKFEFSEAAQALVPKKEYRERRDQKELLRIALEWAIKINIYNIDVKNKSIEEAKQKKEKFKEELKEFQEQLKNI